MNKKKNKGMVNQICITSLEAYPLIRNFFLNVRLCVFLCLCMFVIMSNKCLGPYFSFNVLCVGTFALVHLIVIAIQL